MSEADIHFDFYAYLKAAISAEPNRGGITYGDVRAEYSDGISGRADIVVFDDDDDPVFVVEAKRPDGGSSRETDPYSADVVRQAFGYAGDLGSPFFCTYNETRLIIFDAFEEGVPLLERSQKSYTISDPEQFADTLLDEISRLYTGNQSWDTIDNVFIKRVNTLHEYMTPRVRESLKEELESNDGFQSSFRSWTAAQGIDYPEEGDDQEQRDSVQQEFAEQAAYLLINKVIFYKILEDSPTYREDIEPLAVSPHRVQEDLNDYFENIVEQVDFEAVYDHDEIFDGIPLDSVESKVRSFIIELDDYDLSQFDSDVIGRIYEGVIPVERRRAMGEYYTPPAICDLITRLTIQSSEDEVLDPACGSGGFLVSSYNRVRDLLPEPTGSHEYILNNISGVEINRFPAHLSAINLALQDLSSYTEDVDVEIKDFFDVKKNELLTGREVASASGTETTDERGEQRGGYDAVVGNPPYIRQENIEDKDKVRDHLDNREIDAEYLSRRSDIFTYFLTHGTEFLADGGDLGYIVSDRWLDTKYGEDLQEFILDNYQIRAIIKFDRQVFDDALVDSSVLILRKEDDEGARQQNVAKFIRLKNEMRLEDVVDLVETDYDANQMVPTDDYRVVTRRQSALEFENKWTVFFYAPPIYFDFEASPEVVPLEDVSNIKRGVMTGANAFFTGNTEDFEELGLEDYISPLMKATGQVDNIYVSDEEAYEWGLLDVHDLVEEALESESEFGTSDVQQVKDWLGENDHDALLEYIESGEGDEYHERTSMQSRDVWFDLGDLTPPAMFHTQFTWREHMVHWNAPQAVAVNQFHCIYPYPDDGIAGKALCGMLNSRIVWLVKELTSRRTGGQGMTRLQTMVYETEALPVPDPRELSDSDLERISSAFESLIEVEQEVEDPTAEDREPYRDELDEVVLEVLGLDGRLDELKTAVNGLVESRERAAGQHTEVLVERLREEVEESGAIDLPGVESARESTTLGDFE